MWSPPNLQLWCAVTTSWPSYVPTRHHFRSDGHSTRNISQSPLLIPSPTSWFLVSIPKCEQDAQATPKELFFYPFLSGWAMGFSYSRDSITVRSPKWLQNIPEFQFPISNFYLTSKFRCLVGINLTPTLSEQSFQSDLLPMPGFSVSTKSHHHLANNKTTT